MVCVYDVPLLAYSHPLILGCSRDTWEIWTSAGKGFRMRYNFACKQTFLAKHPVIGLWNRNTNDVLANLSIFDTENQKWWMMVRNEQSLPLSQHRYVQLQICLLSPVEADEFKVKWILFLIYRIYNASTGGRAQQLIRELVLTGCHNTDTLKPILISCIIIAAQRTSSEIISKHQQLRTGEKKTRQCGPSSRVTFYPFLQYLCAWFATARALTRPVRLVCSRPQPKSGVQKLRAHSHFNFVYIQLFMLLLGRNNVGLIYSLQTRKTKVVHFRQRGEDSNKPKQHSHTHTGAHSIRIKYMENATHTRIITLCEKAIHPQCYLFSVHSSFYLYWLDGVLCDDVPYVYTIYICIIHNDDVYLTVWFCCIDARNFLHTVYTVVLCVCV